MVDTDVDGGNFVMIDNKEEQLKEMVKNLAEDYSKYPLIDTSSQMKTFEEAIEDILGHFEEFCGNLDILRNVNESVIEKSFSLSEKMKQVEPFYEQIDKLDEMVQMAKSSFDQLEQQVLQAEQLMANNQSTTNKLFSRFFSTLFNSSSSNNKHRPSSSSSDATVANVDNAVDHDEENKKRKFRESNLFKYNQFIETLPPPPSSSLSPPLSK